ncbi:hypothetical protein SEPCBS57363_000038 [Sporothrix epigloea]|uniref:Uncharacterized protein n=1 Tax=Sporothrix epigloea TaxID=1892477 RepID=A0ABP0D4B3_9PEZI
MDYSSLILSAVAVLAVVIAALFAYEQGFLDPVIEKIGVYFFKAKAKAEEKQLESQGREAGSDFLDGQLKGSQQADDVKSGLGSIGGLKKNA